MKVQFKAISEDFIPVKANSSDTGYDFKAHSIYSPNLKIDTDDWSKVSINPNTSKIFGTGFNITLPEMVEIPIPTKSKSDEVEPIKLIPCSQIQSRSGLGFKHSVTVFNGQIDNTYNKEILVRLTNESANIVTINKGDKIGQLRIDFIPFTESEAVIVKSLADLQEGSRSGFGSTGK
jgi:dUTPase